MSGAIGWGGNDRVSDDSYSRRVDDDAWGGYTGGAPSQRAQSRVASRPAYQAQSQVYAPKSVAYVAPVDTAAKPLKSSKKNALIVGIDMTGSFSSWHEEIYKYVALLHKEVSELLKGDTEILFLSFGDAVSNDKIRVCDFGCDQTLDTYLAQIKVGMGGGGNQVESSEIVLDYIDRYVDVSASQNVYVFIMTDEGILKTVSPRDFKTCCPNLAEGETRSTVDVIRSLRIKADVSCIFGSSGSYGAGATVSMEQSWRDVLGEIGYLSLDRASLCVEVMLAHIAKRVGKLDLFTQAYNARRGGTVYGTQNLATVMKSVALANPTAVKAPTQIGPGTRSLI